MLQHSNVTVQCYSANRLNRTPDKHDKTGVDVLCYVTKGWSVVVCGVATGIIST